MRAKRLKQGSDSIKGKFKDESLRGIFLVAKWSKIEEARLELRSYYSNQGK